MFDLGWQELFIIGTVALIVVGPKDLPKLFNKAGKVFGKVKRISREFYDQINEAAEVEELKNLRSELGTQSDFDDHTKSTSSEVKNKKSNKRK